MSYRFMRVLLFFDLPTLTSSQQKAYRVFVKNLKLDGFYMLQESVYVKMAIDKQVAESSVWKINKYLPNEGSVMTLLITEKQFNSMNIVLGETKKDLITNNERVITL